MIVHSCTTTLVACLATGTPFAVLIKGFAKVQVIDILDCAKSQLISRSAQISVVAEFETVASFKLQACVCITVVTTQTIATTSTTQVTVNNAPVVVAGKALLVPDTKYSPP